MDHEIDITAIDNETGIPQETDGIMGIFIQAVAIAQTFLLNTAYLLTSLADLEALGVTAAYDTTNGTDVHGQISDFYAQATDGALLWIIPVANNTAFATFVSNGTFDTLIRFTGQADPANRVKMIGTSYAPPATLQTATDFPADVPASITALQTKLLSLFLAGYPVSAIVDGYNMSSAVTPATIGTQATNTAYSISLCITGLRPNGIGGVGAALGRFARISIGHGFGAVADGGINAAAAYLTNSVTVLPTGALIVGHIYTVFGGAVVYNGATYQIGQQFTCVTGFLGFTTTAGGYLADNVTPIGAIPGVNQNQINGLSPTFISQLGQKQFMFIRTWENKSGFFWNDGSTCINSTSSFSSQEYNRVINSLAAACLSFFTEFMGSNLPLDASTGNVAQGWLNSQQELFYDQYLGPLNDTGGTGDISDGALIVTGVAFNTTRTLKFKLNVVGSTILGGVNGTVQFVLSL